MVRPELLRAKSLHAEVAYLKDLQRVGEAKRSEAHESANLRERERRFWSETVKSKTPVPVSISSQQPQFQATAQLERMRHAHAELKNAKETHQTAAAHLKQGLAKLSSSQKKVEILEKLLSKAQRIRANQVESRLSEDVADLVTTSRTVSRLRASLTADGASDVGSKDTGWGNAATESPVFNAENQLLSRMQTPITTSLLPKAAVLQEPIPAPSRLITQQPQNSISISNVSCASSERLPSVSMQCSLGTRGSIGLQVSKSESGGLKVIIDPSVSTVATGVMREKGAIQARLTALGIKVTALEIGATDDPTTTLRRSKRSQINEEDDESNIA